ncbi:MAG: DNA mismatch repair protein MutS, partial [Deltaproteobacteria bacterium]
MKEHTTGKRGRRDSLTPIRRQYLALKAEHPDKILLFQMGDFYEAFDEDAHLLAHDLGVTLTTKRLGKAIHVPLAGIPVSRLNHYLARLLQRGRHVAICDQVTPAAGEGLVERKVVRVVSPGTIEDPALLSARRNNYLAAFVPPQAGEGGIAGLAYADISTGEFTAAQMASGEAVGELLRLSPAEVLLPPDAAIELPSAIASTSLAEGHFDLEACRGALASCFGTLAATGIEGEAQALRAAGAIVRYLEARQPHALRHLTRMTPFAPATFVRISPQSFRDLEVFESSHPAGSLLSVLDLSVTAMGGRLLRRRLRQPLCDPESIERRLDGVAWFFSRGDLRRQVRSELSGVTDLERLIGRVR